MAIEPIGRNSFRLHKWRTVQDSNLRRFYPLPFSRRVLSARLSQPSRGFVSHYIFSGKTIRQLQENTDQLKMAETAGFEPAGV